MVQSSDDFWFQNPKILIRKDRAHEFIPTSVMTPVEKLNAVSRFLIYFGLLLSLIKNDVNNLYITAIGLAIIYLVASQLKLPKINSTSDDPLDQEQLQQPTEENPFMNVLLSDDFKFRKPAADQEHPEVRAQIEKHFNKNLFRNVNDIWCRDNSQRQFVTNPATTVPNDRDSFMHWLYDSPSTCKDGNNARCLDTETPRGQSRDVCVGEI